MKKSFYHILLLSALTLGTTSSCDDYLEVDHYDILPEDFIGALWYIRYFLYLSRQ